MFRTTPEAKGGVLNPVKHVSAPTPILPPPPKKKHLLLAVPRWYFCCGSSMLYIVMFMCIWISAIRSPEQQLPVTLPVLNLKWKIGKNRCYCTYNYNYN